MSDYYDPTRRGERLRWSRQWLPLGPNSKTDREATIGGLPTQNPLKVFKNIRVERIGGGDWDHAPTEVPFAHVLLAGGGDLGRKVNSPTTSRSCGVSKKLARPVKSCLIREDD